MLKIQPYQTQRIQHGNNLITCNVTSNSKAQCFWSRILSPLASVKSLLSSITEFMFSTHRASTSLSNTMYLRSFLSVGLLISRKIQDSRPSVQSRVTGSSVPYSSTTVHALAFITYSLVGILRLQGIVVQWNELTENGRGQWPGTWEKSGREGFGRQKRKGERGGTEFLRRRKVGENSKLSYFTKFLVDCEFTMLEDIEISSIWIYQEKSQTISNTTHTRKKTVQSKNQNLLTMFLFPFVVVVVVLWSMYSKLCDILWMDGRFPLSNYLTADLEKFSNCFCD